MHLSNGTKRTWAVVLTALILTASLVLGGCGETEVEGGLTTDESAEQTAAFPVTVTDDAGREVSVEAEPMRIVSLAPANTEIVYALGLFDRLVGVTSYDDYPPEVADLPVMGDFVGPNLEAVAASGADLVLATTGVQADLIEQLEAVGATVLAIDPQTLQELYAAIEIVGAVTGTADEASRVVEEMRAEVESIKTAVDGADPVTCFVEIAQEPLFTVGEGTLIHELLGLAGGVNVVTEPGYVGYSVEQLLEDDPAVYLVTEGSMSDPSALSERPGYDALTAVMTGRIAILSDNLVSRPGPRIVQGLEEIARALHPELFSGSE